MFKVSVEEAVPPEGIVSGDGLKDAVTPDGSPTTESVIAAE